MINGTLLRETIDASGITITHIADKLGCSRNRVYAILAGSDCTLTEMQAISSTLHLTKDEERRIFFAK